MLEIVTVFSARLYGSRSHKNKRVLDALKKAASEVGGRDRLGGRQATASQAHGEIRDAAA